MLAVGRLDGSAPGIFAVRYPRFYSSFREARVVRRTWEGPFRLSRSCCSVLALPSVPAARRAPREHPGERRPGDTHSGLWLAVRQSVLHTV